MPGYITHNIFGKKEYKIMEEGWVKNAVRRHRNAFYVGLQGPDIFFYFPQYVLISKKNLGATMHISKTGEYMSKMLDYILNLYNKTNGNADNKKYKNACGINSAREICTAYFCGFLGHYSLDRTCHPYIYWKTDRMHKTKDYHAKHVALETDIDYILCREFCKKNVSDFPYQSIARLSEKELAAISVMLSEVLQSTFDNIRFGYKMAYSALLSFGYMIGKINDKRGIKEKIVSRLEENLIGHKLFTTLFIGDAYRIKNIDCLNLSKREWFNPWKRDIKENSNFYELTELAGKRYQDLMKLLEKLVSHNVVNNMNPKNKINLNIDSMKSLRSSFVNELGNKSFLTDLTLD